MAYKGKYVDRSPCTRAAGLPINIKATTVDSMQYYTVEEAAENMVRAQCKAAEELLRLRPVTRTPYKYDESIGDILTPELKKSRFVAFREKFTEDMYFKRARVGEAYPLRTKPDHINNDNTTFGDKSERSESLYELMLPRRSVDEVNCEFMRWHDKYLLSHNHYLPSEQICRNYDSPQFDRNATFGKSKPIDWTGIYVKRCMESCDNMYVIGKSHKDFVERNLGLVGKSTFRKTYPIPNIAFGKTTPAGRCSVRALLENKEKCTHPTEMLQALSHLTKIRRSLHERSDYYMDNLMNALKLRDRGNTGHLTYHQILETLHFELIRVNVFKLRNAMRHYNVIIDECMPTERVNIETFWKLLSMRWPLPTPAVGQIVPPNMYNKDTTYRLLCADRDKHLDECLALGKAAAKPPFKIPKEERTTMKDVVAPDIPMHMGLVPSDFEMPRPKEDLRRIFSRVLTDEFDMMWEQTRGIHQPDDDLLSVDQLRAVMDEIRKRRADEAAAAAQAAEEALI